LSRSNRWVAPLEKLEGELKHAEKALWELEEGYRALTASSLYGALIAQTPLIDSFLSSQPASLGDATRAN